MMDKSSVIRKLNDLHHKCATKDEYGVLVDAQLDYITSCLDEQVKRGIIETNEGELAVWAVLEEVSPTHVSLDTVRLTIQDYLEIVRK